MATEQSPDERQSVTLKDIARHCGVDVSTVSRALRDPNRHSPQTTQRILTAADELGYDPARHQAARRLVMRRFGVQVINHLVALVFPPYFYRANYFAEIFQGVLDVLTPEGYGLLTVDAVYAGKHGLPASFSCGDVDGVIALSDNYLEGVLVRLRAGNPALRCPVLTLIMPHADCSSVTFDFKRGGYLAAAHLLELGHRHLLHFSTDSFRPNLLQEDPRQQCLAGYQHACRERGLDPTQHLHYATLETRMHHSAYDAMKQPRLAALSATEDWVRKHPLLRELRRRPEITAILAPNDPTAVIFRDILQRGGYRIPHDISLVGFDDSDAAYDSAGQNILTTVRVPLRLLGRKAARLIIHRVTGHAKKDQDIQFPPTLIVRESTAAPNI